MVLAPLELNPARIDPTDYRAMARAAAEKYGINPDIYDRLINQESGYAADVINGTQKSSAGALGIAQFMPATAARFGIDPLNPAQALDAGAKYIAQNLQQFNGDYSKALAGYNWGEGAVAHAISAYGDSWLDHAPSETQSYISAILGNDRPIGGYSQPLQGGSASSSILPAAQAGAIARMNFPTAPPAADTSATATTQPLQSTQPAFTPAPTQPMVGGEATASVAPAAQAAQIASAPVTPVQPLSPVSSFSYTSNDQSAKEAIGLAPTPEAKAHLQAVYNQAVQLGKDPLADVQAAYKEVTQGSANPNTGKFDPLNPASLPATTGFGTNLPAQAITKIPGEQSLPAPLRVAAESAPYLLSPEGGAAAIVKRAAIGTALTAGTYEAATKAGASPSAASLISQGVGSIGAGRVGREEVPRGTVANVVEEGAGSVKPPSSVIKLGERVSTPRGTGAANVEILGQGGKSYLVDLDSGERVRFSADEVTKLDTTSEVASLGGSSGTTPPSEDASLPSSEPPVTPPSGVGSVKPPTQPVDQVIEHLQQAGAARPDLLATRKATLGRQIAAAAADLEAGGVPARDAFDRATQQLAGKRGSDVFADPTTYDPSLFEATREYSKRTGDFFTGKEASDGLKLLEQGVIPRPFEVEAIGQVFGKDVQSAITDLGDVFKVKRAVEERFTGAGSVPITLGPNGELNAANITEAVSSLLPKTAAGNSKAITGAVQRLIDERRLVAGVDADGKTVLRLKGPQFDALGETVRGLGYEAEPTPSQTVPPVQPRLGEGSSGVPPIDTSTGTSPGFDWKPGQPLWRKAGNAVLETFGLLPRAIQTAFDYSYPLRQGALLGVRHEKEFWSNFAQGFRALYDDKFALERQAAIERAPYNPANLDITHWQPGQKLTDMEEGFMSRLSNMIPGIKQSNRAATVFINGLRSDVTNTFARTQLRYGRSLSDLAPDLEAYANYVNRATGRGNLGQFESSLPALNQVFYGLRRNVAMVQAPGYLFHSSPAVRKEAMLDMVAFVGVGAATLKLAQLAGADVGMVPGTADFGKIRVGNTRVDIWGGYQQLAGVITKVVQGQIANPGSSEEFASAVLPFISNKLAPGPNFAINQSDKLRAAFQPGQKKQTLEQAAVNSATPLAASGLIDAIKEDGAEGGALALTGFFGTGTQSYTAKSDIGAGDVRDAVNSGAVPVKTYLDPAGNPHPIETLADLKAASPLAYDQFLKDHPVVAGSLADADSPTQHQVRGLQDELNARQQQRDDTLLKSDPAAWRAASSDDSRLTAARIDGIMSTQGDFKKEPTTLLAAAQKQYHDLIDSNTDKKSTNVNWDAVDRGVAQMSPDAQKLLFESSLKGETDARKQYLTDIKQLEPYFKQRDEAWQTITAKRQDLQQFNTFDDYQASVVNQFQARGLPHSQAVALAQQALSPFTDIISQATTAYLAKNRNLVPMLDKWGFYIPSVLQPLASPGR